MSKDHFTIKDFVKANKVLAKVPFIQTKPTERDQEEVRNMLGYQMKVLSLHGKLLAVSLWLPKSFRKQVENRKEELEKELNELQSEPIKYLKITKE